MHRPAPPLAPVSGTPEIVPVRGLGARGGMLWLGACYGCGTPVACAADCPQPECTGCGRTRHGVLDVKPAGRGRIPRTVSALGPYRVLVTGSRDWDDVATLHGELDALYARYGNRLVIVHGHCPTGADALADAWSIARGLQPERHPADWASGSRGAGPQRNAAMVTTRPAEVLAFIRNASKGASGCARVAERAGLPVQRFIYGEPQVSASPSSNPSTVTVLRPATTLQLDDPALPSAARRLAVAAQDHGWAATLTAAVAADDRGVVASVAVRVSGLGYAVYRRRPDAADGWGFESGVVADPYVRKVNVGQFTAALMRVPYVPPAPVERAPAVKAPCPGCGAEVSLTALGKIYASHRCKTTEGRS